MRTCCCVSHPNLQYVTLGPDPAKRLRMYLDHTWPSYFYLLLLSYKYLSSSSRWLLSKVRSRGHQKGCAMMQGLLDNPKALGVGGGPGKPMLLSCPGFLLQTNPGCTPPQIPVMLFALPPCSLSGNGQYSQFSGPIKSADLFFLFFLWRKRAVKNQTCRLWSCSRADISALKVLPHDWNSINKTALEDLCPLFFCTTKDLILL